MSLYHTSEGRLCEWRSGQLYHTSEGRLCEWRCFLYHTSGGRTREWGLTIEKVIKRVLSLEK